VSKKTVRALKVLARLAVTFGAAWLIYLHIDWAMLLDLLLRADPVRLALAGVVLSVQFVIMVWRWQFVIEILRGPAVAMGALAVALGRGMLIGQPLPSTLGGDVVRTLALSRRLGLAFAARSVICDRILALAVLVALVVATLPLFARLVEAGPAFIAVAAVSVSGLAAFLVFLAQPRWLAALPRIGAYGTTMATDVRQVFAGGMRGQLIMVLALATHLLGILLIHELAYAVAAPISLLDCLLIVPPALLISSIPISLAGWGVREGALAAGFVLVGGSSEAGVATSILFGLTGPLIGLVTEAATPFVRAHEIRTKDAA
jgi:glycosyltransferase 2 family protein